MPSFLIVSAPLIFLQLLTPSTATYYLKDCPPCSVLLTRLSSGFSPIFLLAFSPSKHLKHHPNHALSPVVFRKVQFSGPYSSSSIHYSTQFTHQSILNLYHHLYADDTQLFISFSPNSFSDSIDHLLRVVNQ